MIERPGRDEYADFYAGYIAALPPGDVLEILDLQRDQIRHWLKMSPGTGRPSATRPASGAFARWSAISSTRSASSATGPSASAEETRLPSPVSTRTSTSPTPTSTPALFSR